MPLPTAARGGRHKSWRTGYCANPPPTLNRREDVLNDYHFVTRWRVRGTVNEVLDILGDAELARRHGKSHGEPPKATFRSQKTRERVESMS
jgi:hypothetical protein